MKIYSQQTERESEKQFSKLALCLAPTKKKKTPHNANLNKS